MNFKKLFGYALAIAALITLCTVLYTPKALAQGTPIYSYQSLGTFTCATNAKTNVNWVIDVSRQASVALQFKVQNNGSETNNLAAYVLYSVDGVTYETVGALKTIAASGSTAVITVTNWPSLGAGYIKVSYITNTSAINIGCTNGSAMYGIKIQSP